MTIRLGALYDEREETFAALIGEKDPRAKMREAEQRKEERAKWTQTLDFLPGDKLTGTLSQLQGKRTNELVLEDVKLKGGQIAFATHQFAQVYQNNVLQPLDTNNVVRSKFQGEITRDTIKCGLGGCSPSREELSSNHSISIFRTAFVKGRSRDNNSHWPSARVRISPRVCSSFHWIDLARPGTGIRK